MAARLRASSIRAAGDGSCRIPGPVLTAVMDGDGRAHEHPAVAGARNAPEHVMNLFQSVSVGLDLTSRGRLVAARGDLSPSCRAAMACATWIAHEFGSTLHVLTSLDVDAVAEDLITKQHADTGDSLLDVASRTLDALTERARAQHVRVSTGAAFGPLAHVVLADAARHGRDLVVVGSEPRGSRSLRRTALWLLRHCPAPVWIARPRAPSSVGCVLAAVDDGDLGGEVTEIAGRLAEQVGARLHVLHAIENSSEQLLRIGGADEPAIGAYRETRRRAGDDTLRRLVARASLTGVAAQPHLRAGEAAGVVAAAARELNADVVVLGTHMHGGLHALIWGSVTERLLASAKTPLLVVKPSKRT